MHDGLVIPPMPTNPTPLVLEVTVSRPLDPICRIASQPRAPKPPYAPPPPPPLPTLHGVVSPPPLQDVVPSLKPPPPPLMDLRSQLIDSIGTILHEYLSPEFRNLPLEQSNVVIIDINFHFFHDNAMLHQVMIDGIGIFNLSLESDFVSSGFQDL
nr:ARM repeat superfamily protein [Tanacetum cinerariifolium]